MVETVKRVDAGAIASWMSHATARDPEVAKDLERAQSRVFTEAATSGEPQEPAAELIAESIILRTGRPVLPIRGGRVSTAGAFIESDSLAVVQRTLEFERNFIERISCVGRIDVSNSLFALDWIGTGWLIEPDVVVTNRHVASLVAARDGGRFVFRPGRRGAPVQVSIDFLHEVDSAGEEAFEVERVIWIEERPDAPDIAFMKLRSNPPPERRKIDLAEAGDPIAEHVAVIGYPARAPQSIIPDQRLMEQVFAGAYDIKRIAPGLWGERSDEGWVTHDCTTLGGNSGSPVIDMRTGRAVALHFAGAFMIENYAVPSSTIRDYLRRRPWQGEGRPSSGPSGPARPGSGSDALSKVPAAVAQPAPQGGEAGRAGAGGAVSITIPLHITVSLGDPSSRLDAGGAKFTHSAAAAEPDFSAAQAAVNARLRGLSGIYAIRHGFVFDDDGSITDQECVVIAAERSAADEARRRLAGLSLSWPIEMRDPDFGDIEAFALPPLLSDLERRAGAIAYNDDDRSGPEFALEPVYADLSVVCHVGPERSWAELESFLSSARSSLATAIYEFNAQHIADAVEDRLAGGVAFNAVLDGNVPGGRSIGNGDFVQSERFADWSARYGNMFSFDYVPEGSGGLIWNSYHIKVTVKDDDESFWLSSGNWKRSSQPVLETEYSDGASAALPGNREWHVIVKEAGQRVLARCFRAHIEADAAFARDHADEETLSATVFVDVPEEQDIALVEEAPAARPLLPSRTITGRMRIQPLLTPDHGGTAFCDPVIALIRSARRSLWFQIPYITPHPDNAPALLTKLMEALSDAARRVDDFRLILRSDGQLRESLEALKRFGVDVKRFVRQRSHTHTKGMIVDGRDTLIGSHNWSGAGVTTNRDASLIFFDQPAIAAYYGEAFSIDWETSQPARVPRRRESEVRLATGASPPPGYVRMPLEAFLDR